MQDPDSNDGKEAPAAAEEAPLETGHRVLVFAQLKALLDIVERDLLQPNSVPFLRLDGRSALFCFPFDVLSALGGNCYVLLLWVHCCTAACTTVHYPFLTARHVRIRGISRALSCSSQQCMCKPVCTCQHA